MPMAHEIQYAHIYIYNHTKRVHIDVSTHLFLVLNGKQPEKFGDLYM